MSGRPGAPTVAADREARLRSQTVFDRPLALEAGAGTGKTATLVARIVAWCVGPGWRRAENELRAHGAQPGGADRPTVDRVAARVLDGVVAITFTEAAAAEMATRVSEAFADLQRGAPPTGLMPEALAAAGTEAPARAAALLIALDHLVVATIHAFCRRLLAAAPLEARVHPGFTVDAQELVLTEVVQDAVEAAFRDALAAPEASPLFALAVMGHEPAEMADAVLELVRRGVPAEALAADPLAPDAVASLAAAVAARARAFAGLLGPCAGGSSRTKNATVIAAALGALADRCAAGGAPLGLGELVSAVAEVLPGNLVAHLEKWARGNLSASETEVLGGASADLPEAARALAALVKHVAALEPERLDLARRALAPLVAAVHAAMRRRGAETFAALLRDARDTLVRQPSVAARVRSEITQLLVDEFQDTDRLQCEILRTLALAGPPEARPGLFLIGDPKQSIYGWRDADLGAYDDFLGVIREAGGEVLPLSVNFRSSAAILGEVERVVGPVMRREHGVQPAFQPLLPWPDRSGEGGPSALGRAAVEYWVSWAPAAGRPGTLGPAATQEGAELEAAALAADLRELHAGGVPWREFGVLLRSTGDIDVYLQALRDASVPYLVERDRSFYRRREIIEATALVRAVIDPGDHLALLAALRSSVVGAPDAALLPLWARSFPDRVSELPGSGEGALDALRSLVLDAAAALPDDVPGLDRIRGWELNLLAFLTHLARLRESFATEPAAVFVDRLRTLTLFEAGEAARSLGRYRVANLERFFRTLVEAIDREPDPHAVLRALRTAVSEVREAEEGRPFTGAEDAVRVMTIHKAKGLDFAHVYLMQAQKRSRGQSRASTDAEERGAGYEYVLLGAATPGWHAVEARRSRVGAAELVRTLYVAMTRAKDRLVVAGVWPEGGPPAAGRARSHMDLLAHREAPDGGIAAAAGRVAGAGAGHEDAAEARWVFPALRPSAPPPPATDVAQLLCSAEEVRRQSARLADLRLEAAARAARAYGGQASEEAHRRLRAETVAERGDEGEGDRRGRGRTDRSPATAAGSAVHRVLERLDLGGDLAAALATEVKRLPLHLRGLAAGRDLAAAQARAEATLRALGRGPLLDRLRAIAPHVVARELPVLLPCGDGPGEPVGFVAGAIDLVYRDPDGAGLVIADYKTDDVGTDDEVARRALAYRPQGEAYRRALREALGLQEPPGFELWFLLAGRIVALPST